MQSKQITTLIAVGAISLTVLSLTDLASPVSLAAATEAAEATPGDMASESAQVARGEYLVNIMACNDCHTPWVMTPEGPAPDMTRMLSGHPEDAAITGAPQLGQPWGWAGSATNTAYAGPWGVSFAANLTPDPDTGLGNWAAETFLAALRTGRHEGLGRPILPPMPIPAYRNATDADLQAMFAYLQSIPAIANRVPQPLEPPTVDEQAAAGSATTPGGN